MEPSKIIVDNIFAYAVATNIMNDNEDLESKTVEKC